MGANDRYIDLHVEDHPTPIKELRRLLEIRESYLAMDEAKKLLDEAKAQGPEDGADELARAALAAERATTLNQLDDLTWLMQARVELARGNRQAAGIAARRALLLNPSWRTLRPATRGALGFDDAMLKALLGVDSFGRLWQSMSDAESVK